MTIEYKIDEMRRLSGAESFFLVNAKEDSGKWSLIAVTATYEDAFTQCRKNYEYARGPIKTTYLTEEDLK